MENNIFLKEIVTEQDPDNSEQARTFYRKMFPKLEITEENQFVDPKNLTGIYRGETIISFNTIAGKIIQLSKFDQKTLMPEGPDNRLEAIDNLQNEVPEELVKQVDEFHTIYHSLANFMPIPRTPAEFGRNANDFNFVKANFTTYADFPERFLADLKSTYFEKKSSNLNDLIQHPLVKDYLGVFSSWEDFVTVNYLEDFFVNGNLDTFFQIAPENLNKATYQDLEKTLNTAISIIKARAKRLENANSLSQKDQRMV